MGGSKKKQAKIEKVGLRISTHDDTLGEAPENKKHNKKKVFPTRKKRNYGERGVC